MASPVWLDGPLQGQQHEIPADVIDQGMYRYTPTEVYTFTLVMILEHRVVVASVANGIPSPDVLFAALCTTAAQQAQG